jgi:hypothetical protein
MIHQCTYDVYELSILIAYEPVSLIRRLSNDSSCLLTTHFCSEPTGGKKTKEKKKRKKELA